MKSNIIISVIIALSVIGLIDAVYSTYEHYEIARGSEAKSFCNFGEGFDCSAVNSSPYSKILGIPVALTGVLWFIVAILLAYQIKLNSKGLWKNSRFFLFVWSFIGFLSVIWFVYAELFLIGSICLLCTIVHIIVIIILILSYKLLDKSMGKYLESIFYK